jgi:DNA-binding NtrC family response regulator
MPVILFVDDEEPLRRAVRRWLGRRGVEVRCARGVKSAKGCFARYHVGGAFLDVWLGDGTGIELYAWIRDQHPEVADRVAFLSGDIAGQAVADRRLESLGRPVLTKPFEFAELERLVDQWLGVDAPRDRPAAAHRPPSRASNPAHPAHPAHPA